MRFKLSLDYLLETVKRFPVAILIAFITVGTSIFLNHQEPFGSNEPFFRAAYIGFLVAVIGVILYERFFESKPRSVSLLLQAISLPVAALIYFIAPDTEEFWRSDFSIRTTIILFLLAVAVVWLPTIKNATLTFGKHFIILFKSFFITALFSAILGGGISLILGAWDLLLSSVNPDFYSDIGSLVAYVFAPLYFLSLQSPYTIPYEAEPNKVDDTIHRIFDIILTKIGIPLITIFSLILLAYVVLNFTNISDNELETILISYVVFGWVFLFLIHAIDRQYVKWFKIGFLGALFIVSAFQLIRSIQFAMDFGVTHNRYFVIVFCLVSAIAVFLYYKWPNLIPVAMMAALIISLIPPLDALSVGLRSQTDVLTETVANNEELLVDRKLQPTDQNIDNVSQPDARRIVESARYLESRDRFAQFDFIPEDFEAYSDLSELAAIGQPAEPGELDMYYVSLIQEDPHVLDIPDDDHLIMFQVFRGTTAPEDDNLRTFTVAGNDFEMSFSDKDTLALENTTADEIMTFDFDQFAEFNQNQLYELSLEDATLEAESESFAATLIIQHVSVSENDISDGSFILLLAPK